MAFGREKVYHKSSCFCNFRLVQHGEWYWDIHQDYNNAKPIRGVQNSPVPLLRVVCLKFRRNLGSYVNHQNYSFQATRRSIYARIC